MDCFIFILESEEDIFLRRWSTYLEAEEDFKKLEYVEIRAAFTSPNSEFIIFGVKAQIWKIFTTFKKTVLTFMYHSTQYNEKEKKKRKFFTSILIGHQKKKKEGIYK